MKAKRKTKIFALLMTVVLLFSNSFVYSEAGKCTHGGENFSITENTIAIVSIEECVEALPHPIYVMGKLATCRVWHYRYMQTFKCKDCDATLKQEFIYANEVHEYEHN